MSQKDDECQLQTQPNHFFVRGIRPTTADWLRAQVSEDAPSVPAVIRDIVEEKRRKAEQINRKRRKKIGKPINQQDAVKKSK